MNRDITIVIPCKNEEQNVINVIKLLGKQNLNCQIIVADSSDDKKSFDMLYDYMIRSPKLIKIIRGGLPAVARNNGAKLVKTPYVLFLDADVYITKSDLVNDCLSIAITNDYDLVTCKFRTTNKEYNWVYRIFDIIQWFTSKTKPFAIGGFMLFKTDTFNKLNGFNEQDKIAEDYHLSSQIKPSKFKVVNRYVHTSPRRFKTKGVWYMIRLMIKSWLNRNNPDFFKNDFDYWK